MASSLPTCRKTSDISTKLPLLSSSRSLVSPVQPSAAPTLKEKAQQWMVQVRERLDTKIRDIDKAFPYPATDEDATQYFEEEVSILTHHLVTLMISALQKDDRQSWLFLREVLLQLTPYREHLSGRQELCHYLERLQHHLDVHKERLFDLHVQESLSQVFSKDLEKLDAVESMRPLKVYCLPTPQSSPAPPSISKKPVKLLLPNGNDPYTLERQDDHADLKPKGLTFGDLRASMADVAIETATREAIWSACLGTTAQALNVDIPEEPQKLVEETPSPDVCESESDRDYEEMTGISVEDEEHDSSPMTGRQAVQYFTKCHHNGSIKFMYFNIATSRYFRPYDLVAVPKNKAKKEHYVFSTFGVLHVYPNQPSENMSLTDWQRHAVLFNAASKIPFFKYFPLRKIFKRWHDNVKYAEFLRIRHKVHQGLLQAVPSFGAALIQTSRLCQELLHLKFLPLDNNKCYKLGEFENAVHYMSRQSEKVLERFYRFNKIIVDTVSEESFKKMRHAEEQSKHKTYFSKDSLHMQAVKKKQREENLQKAKEETSRLGNFVKLVDQVLLSHLVQCARTSITLFVHKTMAAASTETDREALFKTSLVFSSKGVLCLSPSVAKFQWTLRKSFGDVPLVLCEAALPLDDNINKDETLTQDGTDDISLSPTTKTTSRHASVVAMMKDPKKTRGVTMSRTSTERGRASLHGEKSTKQSADHVLTAPHIPPAESPRKEDDDIGVATPNLVVPDSVHKSLVVAGQGFVGHYTPLNKGNLEEKLTKDAAYCEALGRQEKLVEEAVEELDDYCEKNDWLNEIQQFCSQWHTESVLGYRGAAAFIIEQKLNELRQWSDRVRNFDKTYVTDNALFFVDCSGIHGTLLPTLSSIFKEVCGFVADESTSLAKKFSNEMKMVLRNLKDKDLSIRSFAVYAKNVAQYKKGTPHYQQRMEYIKSLFEVIRMSYRQLSAEEEKLEEQVMAKWESFLSQMQEAMEFVNTQTPLITQHLEEEYQKLESRARELCEKGTSGQYLDPNQNATVILKQLRQLREQFTEVQVELQKASKWKDAISGAPYDLTFLNQMASQMDIRQELWKYVELTTHTILEWKAMLFKKLNARKVLDKIQEWQVAASQLHTHLPVGDELLTFWYKQLNEFKQDLPILHKLSNDALKVRHWKSIFLGMGEQYDPDHQFTVEELLAYRLASHKPVIDNIYAAALAEFAIEQKLIKIKKLWVEREFKLGKHIPDSVYRNEDPRARSTRGSSAKKTRRYEKPRQDKGEKMQRYLPLREQDLYVLIEVEELKYLLEDSRVTVEGMMASPYVADHKSEVEYWCDSLAQIEEIVDLWHVAQTKWLYLLKIFEEPEMFRKLDQLSLQFEGIHNKLIELMTAVVQDPLVTSMINRQRGEKGFRVMQGERLRTMLLTVIDTEESLLKQLNDQLDTVRSQFPRLYFLSDHDLVGLLSISRNPKALLPYARKCFLGVEDLNFALPMETGSLNTALDYALNVDKLEVTKLQGSIGEELILFKRLHAYNSATKWLSTLENYIKTTLQTIMETCIQARLEDGSKEPLRLLEELNQYEERQKVPSPTKMIPASASIRAASENSNDGTGVRASTAEQVEEIRREIHHTFSHWILRFPAQCVLTADAIMWERGVFRALERSDKDELKAQRQSLVSRIDQYIQILRENGPCLNSNLRTRLHCMLGNLVQQGIYHRDVIDKLLANKNLSDSAFDWLSILKYHMEIKTVLQAKTEDDDSSMRVINTPKTTATSAEDFAINRTMTTVSTGYQFGTCSVSQMGATFNYDQEYLGPTTRLVFTPLTERAFLSLTMSLKSFQCGVLMGCAGTGKSATVSDLAKALGRHMVTVNCNEDLTPSVMNQYLNGVIQSGAWALFDDAHRMTTGLMSVFAQQLDYLRNALHVLDTSSNNQYGIRGQPRFDKNNANRFGEKKIRRNSLTTLHSLPVGGVGPLERQATVPHGFNEEGLITYFEDPWVKERERRHSIEKEIEIKESELYKSMRPPPLFYEHVTLYRKPKPNFTELIPTYVPYKPTHIGNVLFNGKLIRASANFGCFMTVSPASGKGSDIPGNLRLCMRPCSLVVPDTKVIAEVILYWNGFQQYQNLAAKLNILFDLLKTQLPRKLQYNFGLKTLTTILNVACTKLQHYLKAQIIDFQQKEARRAATEAVRARSVLSEGTSTGKAEPSTCTDDRTESRTSKKDESELDKVKSMPEVRANRNRAESVTAGHDVHKPADGMMSVRDLPINTAAGEEECLIQAISLILGSKMSTAADTSAFTNLLRDVFPSSARPKSGLQKYSSTLVSTVSDQLRQENLQATQNMVNKILQLHAALKLRQGVILVGPPGSGKSTCYRILAKALNLIHNKAFEVTYDDDLKPEHNMSFHQTQIQRLKIYQDAQQREESLNAARKWQKLSSLSSITSVFNKSFVEEDVEEEEYPKVNTDVIFPNAMSPQELFGEFQEGQWRNGLLATVFRNSYFKVRSGEHVMENFDEKKNKAQIDPPSVINSWVVLDGSLDAAWVDSMNTLLDDGKKLSLANRESISLKEATSVVFELSSLRDASPSIITRCALVHCGKDTVSWKSLVESWGEQAKQRWVITAASLTVINSLVSSTFAPMLAFLEKECMTSLQYDTSSYGAQTDYSAGGTQEVMQFLNIMSAYLDMHLLREDHEKKDNKDVHTPEQTSGESELTSASGSRAGGRLSSLVRLEDTIPNYLTLLRHMFAFSYIWGFGGNLHESCMERFDEFARETLKRAAHPISLPAGGLVYDFCVDCTAGGFVRWSERQAEKTRNLPPAYTLVPEVERICHISDLLLSSHKPVLITGAQGAGKSSLVQNLIQSRHQFTKVTMSPGLTSAMLQSKVSGHVLDNQGHRSSDIPKSVPSNKPKTHHLFFIEDMNAAKPSNNPASQACLELLRQVLDLHGVYDSQRKLLVPINDVNILAAATSPGNAGSGLFKAIHAMSPRLIRHFVTLTLFSPSHDVLHSIYTKHIHSWLEEFPNYTVEHHEEFARAITQGVIDMYVRVRERFPPSPLHPQCIFTLHDIGHVLEGILLMSPRSKAKLKPKSKKKAEKQEKELLGDAASKSGAADGRDIAAGAPPMMRVITRLWCHEATRVFGDRLVAEDDLRWFSTTLEEIVVKNFCTGSAEWLDKMSTIHETPKRQSTPVREVSMISDSDSVSPDDRTAGGSAVSFTSGSALQSACTSLAPDTTEAATPQTEQSFAGQSTEPESLAQDSARLFDKTDQHEAATASCSPVTTTTDEDGVESDTDSDSDTADSSSSDESIDAPSRFTTENHLGGGAKAQGSSSVHPKPIVGKMGGASRQISVNAGFKTSAGTKSSISESSAGSEPAVSELTAVSQESAVTAVMSGSSLASATIDGIDSGPVTPASLPETNPISPDICSPKSLTPAGDGNSSHLSAAVAAAPGMKKASLIRGGGKRGVTFKAGLIADREYERYAGPLLTLDQIREPGESLTEFIFSKYIMSSHAEMYGLSADKGYMETSEEQLMEALYTCLSRYNHSTQQKLDLVFFHEAVQHATRLSRVLATPSGHALLLSTGYCVGRSTLVRLAAHFANCKLFEPKKQVEHQSTRFTVHEHLKRCSRSAAFHGKQVVLLLHEELGLEAIQDVCAFIKEGMCPGLYTPEEIQNIATQMTPGQVKTTRIDKIEAAFNKYLLRVKQNLHVVTCLNFVRTTSYANQTPLYSKLTDFPALVTQACHVDVYEPWAHDAYVAVAEYWLRDPNVKIPILWNEQSRSEQISLVSMAMAFIHCSSVTAIEKLHSHQRVFQKIFSPLSFMEFVHFFRVFAAQIVQKEKAKIEKFDAGLAKMNEAFESISVYKQEVSTLIPRHQGAMARVKEHVECVETQREEYIKALDSCKEQEEGIERMMAPLESLRQEAQLEFDKVNPTYSVALQALESFDKNAVAELKSYLCPPEGIIMVTNAICLLFRRPQTFEEAKMLMIKENFVEDLIFYDKDNVPDDIFTELASFYYNPCFNIAYVKKISQAAACLCKWVRAVYEYAHICRTIKPKMRELLDAEDSLNKAQAVLGAKRVEANRIKSALETRIKAHKEAVVEAKLIEKQIQGIEKKIHRASHVMENMSVQHAMWKSELKVARGRVRSSPADALLTAACVCYHGPLDNRTRAELMHDWLNRCETGNFDPGPRVNRQVKPVSLSAKMESLLKSSVVAGLTESVHSIQHGDAYQTEGVSHRGDDVSSIHESVHERASSTASSMPQMSVYKHQPSVYDTGISYKTEVRMLDQEPAELESMDASSVMSKNLLAVREGFTLQDVLSSFDEIGEWKMASLPSDVYSVHNALIMRASCKFRLHCWPLLVDPDHVAERWVRTLQRGSAGKDTVVPSGGFLKGPKSSEPSMRPLSRLTEASPTDIASDYTQTVLESETLPGDSESRGLTTRQTEHLTSALGESRALTSITHYFDLKRVKIEENIDLPEDNLWVIDADDVSMEAKLVNAIFHGVTVLIEHLERQPIDPLFRALLLKQFSVDKDGRQTIRIADSDIPFHPNFSLYLSCSMPIFLQGDSKTELPLQRMCVVDLSTSQEGIIDRLLHDIMAIERPEYEGQKRSIESDLLHTEQELNSEQEAILQKTLCLNVPILDEKTMLESLISCQRNIDRTRMILEETHYLEEHLREKCLHYIPVATHGAKLYEIILRVCVLNPYYHITLHDFLTLFMDTVHTRHRGKGSTGAVKARSQELIDATTAAIHTYVSNMLFERHCHLFSQLVVLERMRMAQLITNQELGLFVNGVDTLEMENNMVFDDKPEWLSNKVWLDCAALESTSSVFRGLRQNIAKNSCQWKEYFLCPVVLMNPLPGRWVEPLSVFQCCLLWRICASHRMQDVCEALVLHELGGVVNRAKNYDVSEVYSYTDKHRPVLFLLPTAPDVTDQQDSSTAGQLFTNPAHEVVSYGREVKMAGRVHIITCGVPSQMDEIRHALSDCMQNGSWLVLQNAHLATEWTDELRDLIKIIIESGPMISSQMAVDKESTITSTEDADVMSTNTLSSRAGTETAVHRDFRLWITTRADSGCLVPNMLIQHGVKVSCELVNNFPDTLYRSFLSADKTLSKIDRSSQHAGLMLAQTNNMLPMSLLYATLLHQQLYMTSAFSSHHHWSSVDLTSCLEQLRTVLLFCQRHRGIQDLTSHIYSGHCLDLQDAKIVQALSEALILNPKALKALKMDSKGVASVLSSLLPSKAESFSDRLRTFVNVTADTLSLPNSAESSLRQQISRCLLADLVKVIGSPDLFTSSLHATFRRAENVLQEVISFLDQLADSKPPVTNPDAFYPMDIFFHSEIQILEETRKVVAKEAASLLKVSRGQLPYSTEIKTCLEKLSQQQVPLSWEAMMFPSGLGAIQWVKSLSTRQEKLRHYIEQKDTVVAYELRDFCRPDHFIQCVLQTFVRKEFKNIHTCQLDVQFLAPDSVPSSPPATGVYLTHLYLHNAYWEPSQSALTDTSSRDQPTPTRMPYIWLRPIDKLSMKKNRRDMKHQLYDCPVYVSTDGRKQGWQNVLASLELPTYQNPALWAEKRVFLTCQNE